MGSVQVESQLNLVFSVCVKGMDTMYAWATHSFVKSMCWRGIKYNKRIFSCDIGSWNIVTNKGEGRIELKIFSLYCD
jgi:hypothetical protein